VGLPRCPLRNGQVAAANVSGFLAAMFKFGGYSLRVSAPGGSFALLGPSCKPLPADAEPPSDWASGSKRGDLLVAASEARVQYDATIGNGFLASSMSPRNGGLFLAGVFSGGLGDTSSSEGGPSHRAELPSPLNLSPEGPWGGNAGAALDLRRAAYIRRSLLPPRSTAWGCHDYVGLQDSSWCKTAGVRSGYEYRFFPGYGHSPCGKCWCCKRLSKAQPQVLLEQRFYAHRSRPSIMVMEYSATWSASGPETVVVAFDSNPLETGQYPDFTAVSNSTESFVDVMGQVVAYRTWEGQTVSAEPTAQRVGVAVAAVAPDVVVLSRGKTYAMLASFSSQEGGPPPRLAAAEGLKKAWGDLSGSDSQDGLAGLAAVRAEHERAWADLWRSGVEIEGRLDVQRAAMSSMYYILSSLREEFPFSLSPGGLASNGYRGHTFWDTETWMFPPLLVWHPDLARSLLQYRADRLEAARQNADSHSPPYAGTMFPWESAHTGCEVTTWAGGLLEQHISGDIALVVRHFTYMSGNLTWLLQTGFPVLEGVANFYASRAVKDASGAYHIRGVVPPDEWAYRHGPQGVDDSIYINALAKKVLLYAAEAAPQVGGVLRPEWREIADSLVLPFSNSVQRHPEFQGYSWGEQIKQADVVLLSYPLNLPMSEEVRLHDLEYYAQRTSANGPAMTWSMHAIGYLQFGRKAEAAANFNRSFANIKEPFGIWTETPMGGVTNFITGAGGFLQAVVFGYGGLRIHSEGLTVAPVLMEGATSMTIRGIHLRGSAFSLTVDTQSITLQLTEGRPLKVAMGKQPNQMLHQHLVFPVGSSLTVTAPMRSLRTQPTPPAPSPLPLQPQLPPRERLRQALRPLLGPEWAPIAAVCVGVCVGVMFAAAVVLLRRAAGMPDSPCAQDPTCQLLLGYPHGGAAKNGAGHKDPEQGAVPAVDLRALRKHDGSESSTSSTR